MKASNDSNDYSAPSSGGEQSYEEADNHRIFNQVAAGSGGSTSALSAGASTNRLGKTGSNINKPQGPAKSQDAKQELDSCRVRVWIDFKGFWRLIFVIKLIIPKLLD